VIGTVLALRGFAPIKVAARIAGLVDELQPGWTGPRFAGELAVAIESSADQVSRRP
jgi:hypothetical protein